MVDTRAIEPRPLKGLAVCFNTVAGVVLVILMLITCVDVVGRYVFNSPLTGSTELTEMALAVVVFAAFPVISWRSEHVVVDILDRFVSPFVHYVRTVLFNLISALALFFLGQRIWLLADRSAGYGEVSEYLGIPTSYIIYFIAAMCFFTALLVLTAGQWLATTRYRNERDHGQPAQSSPGADSPTR